MALFLSFLLVVKISYLIYTRKFVKMTKGFTKCELACNVQEYQVN